MINYAYLWRREHELGREEGGKDRASVIVLCVDERKSGSTTVTVLPITHTPPMPKAEAVEFRWRSSAIWASTTNIRGLSSRREMSSPGLAMT